MTLNNTIKILIIFITINLSSCVLLNPGLVLHPLEKQPSNYSVSPTFSDYNIKNVAVLPFEESLKTESDMFIPPDATSVQTSMPEYYQLYNDGDIAARLMENELLATFKYQPVDRTIIDQLIQEMEFQLSDLVNPETVVRIGNLTGADAVLTGTVIQASADIRFKSFGGGSAAVYIGKVHL